MSNTFSKKLITKVLKSLSNDYSDNHDTFRFGVDDENYNKKFKEKLKFRYIYPRFIPKNRTIHFVEQTFDFLSEYGEKLEKLYNILEDEASRLLLIDIVAYRLLGKRKVKLNTNTPEFWKRCNESYLYADKKDFIDLNFLDWRLYKTDFSKYNIPLVMYALPQLMVYYGFLGHYTYKSEERNVEVENDDIVFDCGGCYGDTAVLFGSKAGKQGKVYSFEFIPSNIEIFKKNIALNENVKNVEIISNPLWEKSDIKYYYKDDGPSSSISSDYFEGNEGVVISMSIDDFVKLKSLPKVDFIKMDIEGAELPSLRGAVNTLQAFKPKLAISIYHSMNDFVEIPEFLNNLGLGYKFYLGHYTIHAEETVLYAIAE